MILKTGERLITTGEDSWRRERTEYRREKHPEDGKAPNIDGRIGPKTWEDPKSTGEYFWRRKKIQKRRERHPEDGKAPNIDGRTLNYDLGFTMFRSIQNTWSFRGNPRLMFFKSKRKLKSFFSSIEKTMECSKNPPGFIRYSEKIKTGIPPSGLPVMINLIRF